MRIVIAGGSGFLGSALTRQLIADGHDVVVLTRRVTPANAGRTDGPAEAGRHLVWVPNGTAGEWARTLDTADAVVNLAGESIAARRWTAAQKEKLRTSRLLATRSLVAAIRGASNKPRVFVSASAVGYYGDRGDETLTEASG